MKRITVTVLLMMFSGIISCEDHKSGHSHKAKRNNINTSTANKSDVKASVCQITQAKAVYIKTIPISSNMKEYVQLYKENWAKLCANKKVSLYKNFEMANKIMSYFQLIFYTNMKNKALRQATQDYMYSVHQFLPGISAPHSEYNFSIKMSHFRAFSDLGNENDRRFLSIHNELMGDGVLPVWYTQTWDLGGCVNYGEHPWIKSFKAIKEGKKLDGQAYQIAILRLETLLLSALDRSMFINNKSTGICTCTPGKDNKAKAVVINDYRNIISYLNKTKDYPALYKKLQLSVTAIKNESLKILVDREKHCSGG
ncbi:MAG: hypothetical protein OEZ36_14705 [Spirochaetota bacterium]|nr:hypothetical protein [Spirochaetota bacterium]